MKYKILKIINILIFFLLINTTYINAEDSYQSNKISLSEYSLPGLNKIISVDFRDLDIVEAFKFLAIEGDLNIVTAADVTGSVNLFIKDVSIRGLIEMLTSMYDLVVRVEDNIIQIFADETKQYKETVVKQLKYATPSQVAGMLEPLKSSIGQIVFDDKTGVLILVDKPNKIEEMVKIIEKVEMPTVERVLPVETKVFELQYADIDEVLEEVSSVVSEGIGSVRSSARANTIVVTDLPHQMEKIETIIEAFDRKSREVFIEAKIVQVSLSNAYKWGVDWEKLFGDISGIEGMSVTPEVNMPLSLSNYGKLTLSKAGSTSISFILEMLSTIGETKILSNPHIATEDGKEATLNVITKQPYSQTTTTTTDAATTEAVEFTFVDVGVKLNVTPRINKKGYISMKIKPEVSSITSFFPDSTSANRVPVVETSNAESTVLIKDGTTIIIAGMIKDEKTSTKNKVPVLGDVPLVGKLFSNSSDSVSRNETIVFLTPHIISGDETYSLQRQNKKVDKGLRIPDRKSN